MGSAFAVCESACWYLYCVRHCLLASVVTSSFLVAQLRPRERSTPLCQAQHFLASMWNSSATLSCGILLLSVGGLPNPSSATGLKLQRAHPLFGKAL